jgi:hypothetical protein
MPLLLARVVSSPFAPLQMSLPSRPRPRPRYAGALSSRCSKKRFAERCSRFQLRTEHILASPQNYLLERGLWSCRVRGGCRCALQGRGNRRFRADDDAGIIEEQIEQIGDFEKGIDLERELGGIDITGK